MDVQKVLSSQISFPDDYQITEVKDEVRNNKFVTITRFQPNGNFQLNGPRIIAVTLDDTVLSIKNMTHQPEEKLLSDQDALTRAENIFKEMNPSYAKHLSFLRIEHQNRTFFDENNQLHSFPVQWVKFGHGNGSYNWVTLGGGGEIIEMEIGSRWDYFGGRRATEMWDNDDWVLAHEGRGPQLAAPMALA